MKYGIYYAFWEKEWGGNFIPYVEKVKRLGFDTLEVSCANFDKENDSFFTELRNVAEANDILLTGGYGPIAGYNLASADSTIIKNAFAFYADMFRKMEMAGIGCIGGALYSYWPVDFSKEIDKPGDFARSVANMKILADMAADHGIQLNMEVLTRFEGYMINTCEECLAYVKAVDKPNVKVMLDTFHMNIEEDSIVDAIRLAGKNLGHLHVGEANRRPPRPGRMPWKEIGAVLKEIDYNDHVVMEPFVKMGGQIGKDIRVWRDISKGATVEDMDNDAAASVKFLRSTFENA